MKHAVAGQGPLSMPHSSAAGTSRLRSSAAGCAAGPRAQRSGPATVRSKVPTGSFRAPGTVLLACRPVFRRPARPPQSSAINPGQHQTSHAAEPSSYTLARRQALWPHTATLLCPSAGLTWPATCRVLNPLPPCPTDKEAHALSKRRADLAHRLQGAGPPAPRAPQTRRPTSPCSPPKRRPSVPR